MTDAQGQFTLPPDDSITSVLVVSTMGFAELSREMLAGDPTMLLQPWGRLEGRFDAGSASATNHCLLFQYREGKFQGISSDFTTYQVRTDDQGKFVFPRVPPGKHRLVELIPMEAGPGRKGWMHQPLTEVEIRPGETSTINIDASKRPARL